MRKIIFAILFFLLFFVTSSNNHSTYATSCCADGYFWCSSTRSGGAGCVKDKICVSSAINTSKYSCGASEDCNSGTQTCTPKGKRPDACPGGKYLWVTAGVCCDNKEEGIAVTCQNSTAPIGCKPDKTTLYKLVGDKCVGEKSSPVYLCSTTGKCETALGSIDTTPAGFINSLLNFALPLAVVVLILALIYVGYLVITSRGNAEKLQAAKELFTSVITGLVLLIFALVILNLIGHDLLGITSAGAPTR